MCFLAAPNSYRKMLFLLRTKKLGIRNPETLAERYVRSYGHLIPGDVEVFELDEEGLAATRLWQPPSTSQGVVEPSRHVGIEKPMGQRAVFQLKLHKTYYNQGFFNVTREFDHNVGAEGPIDLTLRGVGQIEGYANRRANANGTARVMGRIPLRDWFQRMYSEGDTILIRFETPRRLVLG